MSARILWLCVNYFQPEVVREFLTHLSKGRGAPNWHVMVADISGDFDLVPESFGPLKVQTVSLDRNVGYFPACHLAMKEARYIARDAEWIVVTNVDIEFANLDELEDLLNVSGYGSSVGAIAPRIVALPSMEEQNPFLARRPSWLRELWWRSLLRSLTLFHLWTTIRSRVKRRVPMRPALESREIFAPHGACVLLNRVFFERGGTIRREVPLYGEELFLAGQCVNLGLKVLFRPELVVWHQEHSSTSTLSVHARHKRLQQGMGAYLHCRGG